MMPVFLNHRSGDLPILLPLRLSICEKCGMNPGVLIWIPIVRVICLLQVAKMAV